ncbi:hypothetical protein C8035_v011836 [Colletotrichum spinosum]|uniref:Heterokaryon incompatibility domain-containing protein n=1 Tax=Colletotrichum spinosum TaxID=1347390 RepID=A0A4R8Q4R8_9PEZI|nr:hypothetical protein C8035_v011836 [Colletotrichum spinosum]
MAESSALTYRGPRGTKPVVLDANDDQQHPSRRHRHGGFNPDAGCSRCSLMFSEAGLAQLNAGGFRHHSQTECVQAIKAGCPSCYLIAVALEEVQAGWVGDEILTFWNRSSLEKSASLSAQFIDVLQGKTSSGTIAVYPYAKKDDPAATLIHRRPLQRDVKSTRVMNAARSVYSKCRKDHPQCRYARDATLPSRVLDVGTAASPTLNILVNDTERRGEYLALSYCWGGGGGGGGQKVLLRRETLGPMSGHNGLSERGLQRSVRDAVAVTRLLGFRYLWVDALCIVQDCDADKAEQIGRMATIYKNAAVTLAAGTAESAADGFLDAGATYLPDVQVAVDAGTLYLRSGAHEPNHALDGRGWVLQEFLLSSRLLLFSEYELLWQCKTVDLRSVAGGGGEDGLDYLQPLESLPWTVFNEDNADAAFGREVAEKRYLWKTIVQQYTRRRLSRADDRLDAVRGITRELETLWGDFTYFGLWHRWFVDLLAWKRSRSCGSDVLQRDRSSRAPTWSWASVDGPIEYTAPLTREDAKLVTVDVLGTRVPKHVVLSCCLLKEDLGDQDSEGYGQMITDYPDLEDVTVEVQDQDIDYVLLGTTVKDGVELGVALMVIEGGSGYYQRVGLATFGDMATWKGAERQDIKLK